MVGREQLVAGGEPEAPEDRVDPGGRVRDEREVLGIGADEVTQNCSSLGEIALEVAAEELDGLCLHAVLPRALGREDDARTGAVRAVVEEVDRRIERPVVSEGRGHQRSGGAGGGSPEPSSRSRAGGGSGGVTFRGAVIAPGSGRVTRTSSRRPSRRSRPPRQVTNGRR